MHGLAVVNSPYLLYISKNISCFIYSEDLNFGDHVARDARAFSLFNSHKFFISDTLFRVSITLRSCNTAT